MLIRMFHMMASDVLRQHHNLISGDGAETAAEVGTNGF